MHIERPVGGWIVNIELAYVKSDNTECVFQIVQKRLNGELAGLSFPKGILMPDSYSLFLANNEKRKIAVSRPINGWITLIESKEVNDYALLFELSKELKKSVVAIVQSDVIGAWGYAQMSSGEIIHSYFSEEDDDIEGLVDGIRTNHGITCPILFFRDAVKQDKEGWVIAKKEHL